MVGLVRAWWLRGIGLVLLLAAGLKLHALATDPLAGHSFLNSARAELAIIEFETVLALMLIGSWAVPIARLGAIGFFALVLGVSVYQGWMGHSRCGCLGRVEVHPWTMAMFNAIVLAGLLVAEPLQPTNQNHWGRKLWRRLAGIALLLVVTLGTVVVASANVSRTLAWFRGQPVVVAPFVSELGEGRLGEWRVFRLQVLNFSDQPVRIVAGSKTCSVQATESLPVSIPAGGSAELTVLGRFTGTLGRFQQQFVLYTDLRQQPVIFARFTGRVVVPSQNEPP